MPGVPQLDARRFPGKAACFAATTDARLTFDRMIDDAP
jgi:hypothetical protein